MQYVFILGRNTALSVAEILALLPDAVVVHKTSSFLILENIDIDAKEMLDRLGGTIKIGEIISDKIDQGLIVDTLKGIKSNNKLKFGLSYYGLKQDMMGMDVKSELKRAGISCRLVTGKEKALSSVIVTKNKVNEFLILGDDSVKSVKQKWLGKTLAIQDFEGYGFRDFGRPDRDMKSGSLPPKLAQMMINLTQAKLDNILVDPFCGSGTILQEAILLGYKNIIGSDKSNKAIEDSTRNLQWLGSKMMVDTNDIKLYHLDVQDLSSKIKKIDAIATEPYLGPALHGNPSEAFIEKNVKELEHLYRLAFKEFSKAMSKGGRVVMVFPTFKVDRDVIELDLDDVIKELGFTQVNDDKLLYGRPGQYLYRDIKIFEMN